MIAAAVRPDLQAALREARKRSGAKAHVEYREHCADREPLRILVRTLYAGLPWPRSLLHLHAYPCNVGTIMMGLFFEVRGEGETFAEAFKQAAQRDAHRYGSRK